MAFLVGNTRAVCKHDSGKQTLIVSHKKAKMSVRKSDCHRAAVKVHAHFSSITSDEQKMALKNVIFLQR